MKKVMAVVCLALLALSGNAKTEKDSVVNKNKPVFTVVKQNPITSIKDQNRSGTCWDYSTLSYFESEILKKTGKTYDLCESFVANKTYMDRATQVVRLHGDCQFSQEDRLTTLSTAWKLTASALKVLCLFQALSTATR